jgi:hypothetical protein
MSEFDRKMSKKKVSRSWCAGAGENTNDSAVRHTPTLSEVDTNTGQKTIYCPSISPDRTSCLASSTGNPQELQPRECAIIRLARQAGNNVKVVPPII